jgi:hypothetical protein
MVCHQKMFILLNFEQLLDVKEMLHLRRSACEGDISLSTLSQSLEIDYLLEKRCGTRSILFSYYNWVLLEAVDLRREIQHQLLLSTFSTPMRLWGYILFF